MLKVSGLRAWRMELSGLRGQMGSISGYLDQRFLSEFLGNLGFLLYVQISPAFLRLTIRQGVCNRGW